MKMVFHINSEENPPPTSFIVTMVGEGPQTGKAQPPTFIFVTLYLFITGQTIMGLTSFTPQLNILLRETSFQRNI